MVLLVSWICGGMGPKTGMVKWKDIGVLEKTGREDGKKRGVALYVNDQLEYIELCWEMHEKLSTSLWVRIKGITGSDNGDLLQAMQPGRPIR